MAWFSYLLLSLKYNSLNLHLVFALSRLGGENDVSRVKKWRWNKKIWETLR